MDQRLDDGLGDPWNANHCHLLTSLERIHSGLYILRLPTIESECFHTRTSDHHIHSLQSVIAALVHSLYPISLARDV